MTSVPLPGSPEARGPPALGQAGGRHRAAGAAGPTEGLGATCPSPFGPAKGTAEAPSGSSVPGPAASSWARVPLQGGCSASPPPDPEAQGVNPSDGGEAETTVPTGETQAPSTSTLLSRGGVRPPGLPFSSECYVVFAAEAHLFIVKL